MSLKLFWTLLFSLLFLTGFSQNSGVAFNKNAYYKIFATKDVKLIDEELHIIQSSTFSEKLAFEGALLMKKASLITNPKDKLAIFKDGRIKLELSITKNAANVEFRFLRLMIQENVPGIVNYRDNILDDSALVTEYYKTLPKSVQQAVYEYSKNSKTLKTAQLQ